MTRDQWISHICRALALGELASAAVLASDGRWWMAVLVACTAPSLIVVAAGAHRAHRRARAAAQRAGQRERGEEVPPLVPCCSFWLNSDGQVHAPGCARLPLPRPDTDQPNDRSTT